MEKFLQKSKRMIGLKFFSTIIISFLLLFSSAGISSGYSQGVKDDLDMTIYPASAKGEPKKWNYKTDEQFQVYFGVHLNDESSFDLEGYKMRLTIPKEKIKKITREDIPKAQHVENIEVLSDDNNYIIEFVYKDIGKGSLVEVPVAMTMTNASHGDQITLKQELFAPSVENPYKENTGTLTVETYAPEFYMCDLSGRIAGGSAPHSNEYNAPADGSNSNIIAEKFTDTWLFLLLSKNPNIPVRDEENNYNEEKWTADKTGFDYGTTVVEITLPSNVIFDDKWSYNSAYKYDGNNKLTIELEPGDEQWNNLRKFGESLHFLLTLSYKNQAFSGEVTLKSETYIKGNKSRVHKNEFKHTFKAGKEASPILNMYLERLNDIDRDKDKNKKNDYPWYIRSSEELVDFRARAESFLYNIEDNVFGSIREISLLAREDMWPDASWKCNIKAKKVMLRYKFMEGWNIRQDQMDQLMNNELWGRVRGSETWEKITNNIPVAPHLKNGADLYEPWDLVPDNAYELPAGNKYCDFKVVFLEPILYDVQPASGSNLEPYFEVYGTLEQDVVATFYNSEKNEARVFYDAEIVSAMGTKVDTWTYGELKKPYRVVKLNQQITEESKKNVYSESDALVLNNQFIRGGAQDLTKTIKFVNPKLYIFAPYGLDFKGFSSDSFEIEKPVIIPNFKGMGRTAIVADFKNFPIFQDIDSLEYNLEFVLGVQDITDNAGVLKRKIETYVSWDNNDGYKGIASDVRLTGDDKVINETAELQTPINTRLKTNTEYEVSIAKEIVIAKRIKGVSGEYSSSDAYVEKGGKLEYEILILNQTEDPLERQVTVLEVLPHRGDYHLIPYKDGYHKRNSEFRVFLDEPVKAPTMMDGREIDGFKVEYCEELPVQDADENNAKAWSETPPTDLKKVTMIRFVATKARQYGRGEQIRIHIKASVEDASDVLADKMAINTAIMTREIDVTPVKYIESNEVKAIVRSHKIKGLVYLDKNENSKRDGQEEEGLEDYTIEIVKLDPDGRPIDGTAKSTVSNKDGKYSIPDIAGSGTYMFTIKTEDGDKLSSYHQSVGNTIGTDIRDNSDKNVQVAKDEFIKTVNIGIQKELSVSYFKSNPDEQGTIPEDVTKYDYNQEVKIARADDLKRGKLKFLGWNTKQDGTGITYAPDDMFKIKRKTRLYSTWGNATGVKNISNRDKLDKITLEPGLVSVTPYKSGFLSIYNSIGALIVNKRVTAGETYTIALKQAVYIIKTENSVQKVVIL